MGNQWLSSLKHIFKLDPNHLITNDNIERLCQSGTDAIMIGGTLGVTYEDTSRLLKEVRKHPIIVIQEISSLEAIVPGFDYYFIPLVLNAQNPNWILNAHHHALKKYGELINWDKVFIEGYVILNKESSVARLTESRAELDLEDVLAYARMNDQMLNLPILYIEYSGTYGKADWIKEIKDVVNNSRIFYGGGIDSSDKVDVMNQYADTIIVGNIIYENFELALQTIVHQKT